MHYFSSPIFDMSSINRPPTEIGTIFNQDLLSESYCDIECDAVNSLSVDDICTDLLNIKSPEIPDIELYLECTDDGNYTVPCSNSCPLQVQTAIIAKNVNFRVSFPTVQEEQPIQFTLWECMECGKCMKKESLRNKHLRDIHGVQKPFKCHMCEYNSPSQKLLSRHYKRKHKLFNKSKQSGDNIIIAHKVKLENDATFPVCAEVLKIESESPESMNHNVSHVPINCNEQRAQQNCEQPTPHNLEQTNTQNLNQTTHQHPEAVCESSENKISSTEVRSILKDGVNLSHCRIPSNGNTSQNLFNVSSMSGVSSISDVENHNGASSGEVSVIVNSDNQTQQVHYVKNRSCESIESETLIFKCSLCVYVGRTKKLLRTHIRTMHNSERPIYHCELCQYTCKQKKYFEGHMKKHRGDLTFCCDVCKKYFVSQTVLNRHAVCHHTFHSYKCEEQLCKKAFKSQSALTAHKRNVHNQTHVLKRRRGRTKRIECTVEGCNKQFRDRHGLNIHLCSHLGEKPLKCSMCSYECIQKNSMDLHFKSKHKMLHQ